MTKVSTHSWRYCSVLLAGHVSVGRFRVRELAGGRGTILWNVPHLWYCSEENRDSQQLFAANGRWGTGTFTAYTIPVPSRLLRMNGAYCHLVLSAETTWVDYSVLKWHYLCYSNRLNVALWHGDQREKNLHLPLVFLCRFLTSPCHPAAISVYFLEA